MRPLVLAPDDLVPVPRRVLPLFVRPLRVVLPVVPALAMKSPLDPKSPFDPVPLEPLQFWLEEQNGGKQCGW